VNRRVTLTQRTVGKLQVLLNMLFFRGAYRGHRRGYSQIALLPPEDYKQLLYEHGVPNEVFKRIEDGYGWKPNQFLPDLFNGRIVTYLERGVSLGGVPAPNEQEAFAGKLLLVKFLEIAIQTALSVPAFLPEIGDVHGATEEVIASLQLDGFAYINGRVVDAAVKGVDLKTEDDYLVGLIRAIRPPNLDLILYHHREADDTFVNRNWGAASTETRNFFVSVLRGLREVATERKAAPAVNQPISEKNLIDDFRKVGLLAEEEKEAVLKLWVLLSYSGAHPGIQEQDRARLTRLLVLGLTEWLCLKSVQWK